MMLELMSATGGDAPPTIGFVNYSASTLAGVSTTLEIDKPTGVQEGDLMVAVMAGRNIEGWTGDVGWTEVAESTTGNYLRVAWLTAGSSEPASYTFTVDVDPSFPGGGILVGQILAFKNAGFSAVSSITISGGDGDKMMGPVTGTPPGYFVAVGATLGGSAALSIPTGLLGPMALTEETDNTGVKISAWYETISQDQIDATRTTTATDSSSFQGCLIALEQANAEFDPGDLANTVWYDTSDDLRLRQTDDGASAFSGDGDPIGRFTQKSPTFGGTAPLTQPTAANRPTRRLVNGVWESESTEGDEWLFGGTFFNITQSEFWLWCTASVESSGTVLSLDGQDFQYVRLDHDKVFVRAETGTNNEVSIPLDPFPNMTVFMIQLRQSDRTVTVYRDGREVGSATIPGNDWFPSGAQIVMHAASIAGDTPSVSHIAQHGLTRGPINGAEFTKLTTFLAEKGGITL